jgi:hypothetical protein
MLSTKSAELIYTEAIAPCANSNLLFAVNNKNHSAVCLFIYLLKKKKKLHYVTLLHLSTQNQLLREKKNRTAQKKEWAFVVFFVFFYLRCFRPAKIQGNRKCRKNRVVMLPYANTKRASMGFN